jgi:ABC-type uncharacterized transport system involved in gliding motility auxiliary subunit
MAAHSPSKKPSFSRGQKWAIALNTLLAVLMVSAVMVMMNYLSGRYFQRFQLSTRTRVELSSRTVHLLHSLTNEVRITLYYNRDEPLYSDIAELLKEYHFNNPKIIVETVDYDRDPGAAQDLKMKYNLGASTNKNLVIFDCAPNTKILPGAALMESTLEQVPNAPEREFRRKPVAFRGEMLFTAALLAVTNPKPLKACFLQGHGEHRLDDEADPMGYLKFGGVLAQNHIQIQQLSLITNAVPADCNLLIIAGPKDPIPKVELDRIEQYVNEGGRLLVLFNALSANRLTGLEKSLAQWGILVGDAVIKDPKNSYSGTDIVVSDFRSCPAVNPLVGSQIEMVLPREISRTELPPQSVTGLKVEEIAFSGPDSFARNQEAASERRARPLMVAMENGTAKGVATERGLTRMLVVGDSIFLDNQLIEAAANRDFAGYAANWLLDRTLLLEGLGPRPVDEYRLSITKRQLQALQWILLGAMPGGILLFGGLVWLRRRT